jgi:hypothetical protein
LRDQALASLTPHRLGGHGSTAARLDGNPRLTGLYFAFQFNEDAIGAITMACQRRRSEVKLIDRVEERSARCSSNEKTASRPNQCVQSSF